MDAADFFRLRYDALHGSMTRRLLSDLTDTHLRARPEGRNSIVWLLWHVARGEDLGVNVIACEQAEVIDDGDWGKRMGFNDRLAGTGMASDEVTAFSGKVDAQAVIAYWDAVGRRTSTLRH